VCLVLGDLRFTPRYDPVESVAHQVRGCLLREEPHWGGGLVNGKMNGSFQCSGSAISQVMHATRPYSTVHSRYAAGQICRDRVWAAEAEDFSGPSVFGVWSPSGWCTAICSGSTVQILATTPSFSALTSCARVRLGKCRRDCCCQLPYLSIHPFTHSVLVPLIQPTLPVNPRRTGLLLAW
jgi:hypothetical protein